MKDLYDPHHADLDEKLLTLQRDGMPINFWCGANALINTYDKVESLTNTRTNLVSILSTSRITKDRLNTASWLVNCSSRDRISNAEAVLLKIKNRNQDHLQQIIPGVEVFRLQDSVLRALCNNADYAIKFEILVRGMSLWNSSLWCVSNTSNIRKNY